MKIEILGLDQHRCLYDRIQQMSSKDGDDFEVVMVSDKSAIAGYGVTSLPAIVIDGLVRVSGRIPADAELRPLLGLDMSVTAGDATQHQSSLCDGCSGDVATCGSAAACGSCACDVMPMGKKFKYFLLAVIAVSLMAVIVRQFGGDEGNACGFGEKVVGDTQAAATDNSARLIVYYFGSNAQDAAGVAIEKTTANILNSNFAKQLNAGDIDWIAVNTDIPKNAHFIQDFGLTGETVVLVRIDEGKQVDYKRLDNVRDYADDPVELGSYLTKNISTMLNSSAGVQ